MMLALPRQVSHHCSDTIAVVDAAYLTFLKGLMLQTIISV